MKKIPEADWKKLRTVRSTALDRFCRRIISGLASKTAQRKPVTDAHAQYLEIYKYIQEQDKLVAYLFDDWRRSTVYTTLRAWAQFSLLTEAEFSSLSEETRAWVTDFNDIKFYDE